MPKTFDIVMAVFDVGSHVVTQAAASISGSTSLDVQATLTSMFNSQIDSISSAVYMHHIFGRQYRSVIRNM